MADVLGRQLMGVLDPTQDKARTQHVFLGGAVEIARPPNSQDEAAMWHLRFRAHLDGMGVGYTLDHAVTPVPVEGGQRDLISRYGEQPVQQAQAAYGRVSWTPPRELLLKRESCRP